MRLPSRFAFSTTSGLATVLVALHSSQVAAAESDPFALPGKDFRIDEATSGISSGGQTWIPQEKSDDDYVFYADVVLNGELLRGIAKVKNVDGELAIESAFAFTKGLITTFPKQDYIPISTIESATYEFDWQAYRLAITKDFRSNGPNLIDMQKRSKQPTAPAGHITALIVDYDVSVQADRRGVRANGIISPRLAHGNTSLEANFRLSSENESVGGSVTRLDTFLTHRIPQSSTSVTLGDFISQAPSGSRAVRMGGLRIGTNFSLRPDLITQPLPDFTGTVAVPTGIDVLVNDRRVASSDIERGEFTVQSIPVPTGRSDVGVVVRDALGRESLRTVPFYSARSLLAPGLFEGAINLGAVRRRYGVRSSDYGPLAITAMARKGINKSLTLTALTETSNGIVNAGLGADLVVANVALLSVTGRASHNDQAPRGNGSGFLVSAGIESVGSFFSASLEVREVSRGYADIASANGDIPPPSLIAANISFDLADHGRLQISAVEQSYPSRPWLNREPQELNVFAASYRKRLSRAASLSLDVSRRRSRGQSSSRTEWSALVGLSITIGHRSFAQASYSHAQGQNFIQASFVRPAVEPGEFGYSASVSSGSSDRIAGSLSRQLRLGRLELQAESSNGSQAARLNARGAIVAAGGSVFATRSGSGSYLLVDSGGIEGLEVQRENRVSGVTNNRGKLLIDRVPGYNLIKIGIDPAKLPTTIVAKSIEEFVTPAPRAVSKVDLQLEQYLPTQVYLTDTRGKEFKPGTRLIALPSGRSYIVGHGSVIEINSADNDTELKIVGRDGSICQAEIADISPKTADGPASLQCFIRSRSFVIGP